MPRPVLKREQLERAVVKVVAERGLHATTIQDIAGEAQVSPGLLYRYWKSRDDLAGEVYRTEVVGLLSWLEGLAATKSGFFERLEAIVRGFLRFADEKPLLLRFILLSQHDLAAHIPADRGVYALLSRWIAKAVEEGEIGSISPPLAVQFVIGIVLQPVIGAVYGHVAGPISGYGDAIVGALGRVFCVMEKGCGA